MVGAPEARYLLRRARALEAFGHIDPLENLARARAYVFGGGEDTRCAARWSRAWSPSTARPACPKVRKSFRTQPKT